MAYNWAGLLGDIDNSTVRRARSLLEEEEERRRPAGTMRIGLIAEPPQQWTMPSGIVMRNRMAAISAYQATVDGILKLAQAEPREIIALVGALSVGVNPKADDELRRSGGGGGGASQGAGIVPSRGARPSAAKQAWPGSTSRAAIAAGAQPVVIKVTSTVSSRASAVGLITYLGTREVEKENGEKGKADIPILDQDGIAVTNREERAAALQGWLSAFREPYALDAVATLSIKLTNAVGDQELHEVLNAAFGAKPFLYSRHQDGSVAVYAVTSLPAGKIAGGLRAREKDEGPARALDKAEAGIAGRMSDADVLAKVRIVGAAVSDKSGWYFLEKFLRTEKQVVTSTGDTIKCGAAVKEIAGRIWRGWSDEIRIVEPRNAFHVIFSARAGTDANAMKRAVREFLGEQVAGHRWMTAYHPDTSHVHVHAMISARDDVDKALRLTKPQLFAWRERFAEKAREHGIAMVATRRADVATTRPYSQAQVGAYERGRADPCYLKSDAVNQRVERKCIGAVDLKSLANGKLALAANWRETVRALETVDAGHPITANRFATMAKAYVDPLVGIRPVLANFEQQKEGAMPLSLEQFERRVLRANISIDRLEAIAESRAEREAVAETRRQFSSLFLERRRDLEVLWALSAVNATGKGQKPLPMPGRRRGERAVAAAIDAGVAAQQDAIAANRTARAIEAQAGEAKFVQDEEPEKTSLKAKHQRELDKDRDGPER